MKKDAEEGSGGMRSFPRRREGEGQRRSLNLAVLRGMAGVMLCFIDSLIRGWGMQSRRREPSPTDPVGVSSFPCLLRQPTPLHKVVCGLLCSCRLLAELLGGLAYLRCDEAESWCVLVGLAGLLSWRFCMHGAYLQPLFCHTPQLVRGVHEGQIYLKEE